MVDVEFYRLYNGLRARDLMQCLCRDFAVIFAIFTKVCHVFLPFFAVIFYCPYVLANLWNTVADFCNSRLDLCSSEDCLLQTYGELKGWVIVSTEDHRSIDRQTEASVACCAIAVGQA